MMDVAAKNSNSAKEIFLAASRLSNSAERARFLDDVCQSNAELRQRIEHMLAAEAIAITSPLDRIGEMLPPADMHARSSAAPLVDIDNHPSIGPYKLLEEIGEGGMGVVYMALQQKPIRRTVALKIIKPGMDSRQVVARFEAERQALAMMNHPHIAKVLDAGASDSGSPYFVMELVRGVPITEFCDIHQLDMRQRLDLFMMVCGGVQHAHQKGLIHRDLKPSNILVELENVKAVPKIIDFGVAKATQQTLTERTLHTGFSQMIGTPLYMSPEQVELNSMDVDTRSDIYSLGVLLYELLTGSTPFDRDAFKQAGFDEMRRIIREVDPPRPSHRISTLAAAQLSTVSSQRQIDPRKLSSTLRGELDWIVMKALEKDRMRRYESATALADDVQRFLAGDAVLACPPNKVYRISKFARRYRVLISTAALIGIVLIGGLVSTAWQAFRASRAEYASNQSEKFATQQLSRALQSEKEAKQQAARAESEAAIAKAVSEFIANDLIGKADPSHEPDRNILLRVVVDRAAATVASRFQGQPLVEAAVRRTLGETFESLGEYHQAEEQISQVLAIYSREFGDRHSDSLSAKHKLAKVISKQGRALEAQKLFEAVLEIQRSTLGMKHLDTLRTMASLIHIKLDLGDFRDLEEPVRELWEISQRILGHEHEFTLDTMNDVGAVLDHLGRYRDAEEVFRNLSKIQERVFGREHPKTLSVRDNLAQVINKCEGRHTEAEELLLPVLETMQRVLGKEHPRTLKSRRVLTEIMRSQGRHAEAEEVLRELVEISRRLLGDEHPDTIASALSLSQQIFNQGRFAEAETHSRKYLETARLALSEEHPLFLKALIILGQQLRAQQDYDEAEPIFRQALKGIRRVLGPEHPLLLNAIAEVADIVNKPGQWEEAEELYQELKKLRQLKFGKEHPSTQNVAFVLANVIEKRGRYADAEPLLRELLEIQQRTKGSKHESTMSTKLNLGVVLYRQKRFVEAEELFRELLDVQRKVLKDENPLTLQTMQNLSITLRDHKDYEQAKMLQHELWEIRQRVHGVDHAVTRLAREDLAIIASLWSWQLANDAEIKSRNLQKAVELAREAVQLNSKSPNYINFLNNLGVALYRDGQWHESIENLEKADSLIAEGDREHRMFLAMSYYRIGNNEFARTKYAEGAAWIATHRSKDAAQKRYREEAEQLLGLSELDRDELITAQMRK